MNTLADAVVFSLVYINNASADDDRADEDIRALEDLTGMLRQSSKEEKKALQTAVEKARTNLQLFPGARDETLGALEAIGTDILSEDPA